MAKESLRPLIGGAVMLTGCVLITDPLLEAYYKPDEIISMLLQKNQIRYYLQAIGGSLLVLAGPNYAQEKKSDRIEYGLLMMTPNVLNLRKLVSNIRHPIHEILHTRHVQYPIAMEEGVEYHVVEHKLGPKLVTIDVIKPTPLARGVIPRMKQLFDSRFYYGHAEYFPQPFELVDRTFVRKGFDKEKHLQKFKKT